jgi:hypothetical protein
MVMLRIILTLSFTILIAGCSSPEKINEKWYQQRWCEQKDGQVEVRLKDKTRCDCLTDDFAIEVDFAHKWAEAVGQSLHYAKMTDLQAGILLIVEDSKDKKHLARLNNVINFHELPITVWTTNKSELD